MISAAIKPPPRFLPLATSFARLATVCLTLCASALGADANEERIDGGPEPMELTGRSDSATPADSLPAAGVEANQPADNERTSTQGKKADIEDVMQFAQNALLRINGEVEDYTCILIKREYVDGKDRGWQFMEAKIRHEKKAGDEVQVPFSVYLKFLQPKSVAGREVLYVATQNNGDLIARRGGRRNPNMTVQLMPSSPLAMEGNRYPITEIGFQTLAQRLIEMLGQEMEFRDGELQVFENAKVDNRTCTHYRLTHHKRRENLTYHMAEVSVDDELGIPIFYRAFDFPAEEGGQPVLLEQYVYQKIRVNVGLSDSDFDPENPSYGFQLHDVTEQKVTKD